MRQRIITQLFTLITLFGALVACQPTDQHAYEPIKVDGTDRSVISINPNSVRSLILSGGDHKYNVQVKDSRVATVSIHQDTLRVRSSFDGQTEAVIYSHDLQKPIKIRVEPNMISFTRDTVYLRPKDINKSIKLGGGGNNVQLKADDPNHIMRYSWNSAGIVEITALYEGTAKLIASAEGVSEQTLTIVIQSVDDNNYLNKCGVYSTSNTYVVPEINPVFIANNQQAGTFFSGTNQVESGDNWYQKVPSIVNPREGDYVKLALTGKINGEYRLYVERINVDDQLVVLRGKGFKLVVPYYKQ